MSVLGIVRDIVMLPIEIALDVTVINPVYRSMCDEEADTPFGTVDRMKSLGRNIGEVIGGRGCTETPLL